MGTIDILTEKPLTATTEVIAAESEIRRDIEQRLWTERIGHDLIAY